MLSWIWLVVSSDVVLTLISSDFIFSVCEIEPDILISFFSPFSSSFFTIFSWIKVVSDPESNNAFVSKEHELPINLTGTTWRNTCVLFWID